MSINYGSLHYPSYYEWLNYLARFNPNQASQTQHLIELAGTDQCCSACGDEEAKDYYLDKKGGVPVDAVLTLRLCDDCRSIRAGMNGETSCHSLTSQLSSLAFETSSNNLAEMTFHDIAQDILIPAAAVYAAIVATLVLVWDIMKWKSDKTELIISANGKIKIGLEIGGSYYGMNVKQVADLDFMAITVANTGVP